MARIQWWLAVSLVVAFGANDAHAGKKKKKKDVEPAGPLVGWHTDEGATGACYHPPTFADLGLSDRRMARSEVLTEMMGQWQGQREDGVKLDARAVNNVETVLLGFPDKIEDVAGANLAQCRKAMKGGGTGGWSDWLVALPGKLTAGECMRPLDMTVQWYLDLGVGWQGPASVCKGEPIRISGTAIDYYKVDDNTDWINAAGDASKPTSGNEYPCNVEGCFAGMLVARFRGESGAELILPVGLETVFTPPEHGQIEFTVNDTSYFNNKWKVERGMQHRMGVTYEPAGN